MNLYGVDGDEYELARLLLNLWFLGPVEELKIDSNRYVNKDIVYHKNDEGRREDDGYLSDRRIDRLFSLGVSLQHFLSLETLRRVCE